MNDAHSTRAQPLGIHLDGVGRTFDGRVEALRGITAHIEPGAFVAFVGPSGCGKTTLLRLIGGLDDPTAGAIHFVGPDTQRESPGKGDIGFCFQEPRLLPWRTVRRNTALPLELAGVPKARRHAIADDLLDRVGLSEFLGARPHALSGGMRMRVALARALTTQPRLLLLDEPFGALDEITRTRLDDELRQLWHHEPMTVVIITHSISEAVYLADTVHVLAPRPGRIIETLSVDIAHADRTPTLRTQSRFVDYVAQAQAALARGVMEASR